MIIGLLLWLLTFIPLNFDFYFFSGTIKKKVHLHLPNLINNDRKSMGGFDLLTVVNSLMIHKCHIDTLVTFLFDFFGCL